jgi:hypothetical protein
MASNRQIFLISIEHLIEHLMIFSQILLNKDHFYRAFYKAFIHFLARFSLYDISFLLFLLRSFFYCIVTDSVRFIFLIK